MWSPRSTIQPSTDASSGRRGYDPAAGRARRWPASTGFREPAWPPRPIGRTSVRPAYSGPSAWPPGAPWVGVVAAGKDELDLDTHGSLGGLGNHVNAALLGGGVCDRQDALPRFGQRRDHSCLHVASVCHSAPSGYTPWHACGSRRPSAVGCRRWGITGFDLSVHLEPESRQVAPRRMRDERGARHTDCHFEGLAKRETRVIDLDRALLDHARYDVCQPRLDHRVGQFVPLPVQGESDDVAIFDGHSQKGMTPV